MSDAALFVLFFVGFVVLRIVVATLLFLALLPRGDRCPNCDRPTLRLASPLFNRLLPWFRKSWCLTCGWQGLLRAGPVSEDRARHREPTGPRR